MEEITIYEKPTCSKCRVAIELVNTEGIPYRTVRYHDTPLTHEKLAELIRKIGIQAKELLRIEDPLFRALKVELATIDEQEAIQLMIEHPDLMQRPILERGTRAIIGRPTERIATFLQED